MDAEATSTSQSQLHVPHDIAITIQTKKALAKKVRWMQKQLPRRRLISRFLTKRRHSPLIKKILSAGKEGKKQESAVVPPDLIMEILWKLPVKSLLRFKAVCKSWRNLIIDPQFRANYRRIMLSSDSTQSNGKVPVLVNYSRSASILNPYFPYRNIKLPLELKKKFISSEPDFLGPCNGVYLVTGDGNFALLNYATGEYKLLSLSLPDFFGFGNYFFEFMYFGFGSEELEDGRVDFLILGTHVSLETTELYRLSTGRWEHVKEIPKSVGFGSVSRKGAKPVLINGVFYWLERENNGIYYLYSVDTKSCTFTKEDVPDDIGKHYSTVSCYTIGGAKLVSITEVTSDGVMNFWVRRDCDDGRRFWSMKEIINFDECVDSYMVKTSADYEEDRFELVYQYEESLVSFH